MPTLKSNYYPPLLYVYILYPHEKKKTHTGGSPLLDNMELLPDDESSLGLGQQGMDSTPSPSDSIGPYQTRSFFFLPVLNLVLFVCIDFYFLVWLLSVQMYLTLMLW